MKKLGLALALASCALVSTVSMADHRHDLLDASEELAEACEHLHEKLLVTPYYEESQYAVEEMAEAAHHFYEVVYASSDLGHIQDDYREFYTSYNNARAAIRHDYDRNRNQHIMEDWLDISHTFRTVREIMRYYQ